MESYYYFHYVGLRFLIRVIFNLIKYIGIDSNFCLVFLVHFQGYGLYEPYEFWNIIFWQSSFEHIPEWCMRHWIWRTQPLREKGFQKLFIKNVSFSPLSGLLSEPKQLKYEFLYLYILFLWSMQLCGLLKEQLSLWKM